LRMLGDRWHGCGIPQYHRVYYNPTALQLLFARHGFGDLAVSTCVEWKSNFLLKNTATALTRRYLKTNNILVRSACAVLIGMPQKAGEMLSGRLPWPRGDTLLFAARLRFSD
jgi:hypothetical protein